MLRPFIRSGLGFRFKIDCPLSQCNHLLRMSLQVLAYFVSSESLHCLQRRVKELVGDFCEKHRKIFTRHSEPDSKQVLSHQGLILISANQPLIACTGRVKRPRLKVDLPLGGVGNGWVSQLVLCPLSSCLSRHSRLSFGKTEVNFICGKILKML